MDGAVNLFIKYCNILDWSDNSGWIRADAMGNSYDGDTNTVVHMCSSNEFVTGM